MKVDYSDEELSRLKEFCSHRGLKAKKFLAKGHSSRIFLVKRGNKKFAAKVERHDSPRKYMLEKEAFNLKLANSVKVGPELEKYDFFHRVLLMEFVEGKTFREWLLGKRKNKEIKSVALGLLKQGKRLDEIGLDHGQLAGRGVNILVKGKKRFEPVIVDFEKASVKRKSHNQRVLLSFLLKNKRSKIGKRVSRVFSKKEISELEKSA